MCFPNLEFQSFRINNIAQSIALNFIMLKLKRFMFYFPNSQFLLKMCYKILNLVFSLFFSISCLAQSELAKITVNAGDFDRENTITYVYLGGISLKLAEGRTVLYKIENGNEVEVESQLDMDDGPKLYWVINDILPVGSSREYVLKLLPALKTEIDPTFNVTNLNGNLIVSANGKNVLQYNFMEAPLPEGVPEIYDRAGYIHPLWSPSGEVLTRIQPPDHYHHVGIWNPWTHTQFKGKVIDFWNLNKAEGTVRPVEITSTASNNLYGGFKVIHNHIDLNGKTKNGYEIALKEEWNIRVWNTKLNGWIVDFTSTMNNPTDSIFKILEYRYQGFGFRATEKWDDKTATLLTSEGKNKGDGNSTRARWCDVNGVSNSGTSGVLFITNPANYNYPEPIRIWPEGANNGKENVFFNFNPAMDRDWDLKPGITYQLKYRMFVYDGKITADIAEKLWRDFAFPPQVSIDFIRQ